MSAERTSGVVKRFSDEKGYGFISVKGSRDVFVSAREVKNAGLTTLSEGQHVSFMVKETDKGLHAENLSLLASPNPGKEETGQKNKKWRPDTHTDFYFGPEYLENGYFQDEDEAYPQLLDEWAIGAAKLLGNKKLPNHQIRRFFNKAQSISDRLMSGSSFNNRIRSDIISLKADAARAVGRGVVPEEFKMFIDKNVELSIKDAANFQKGFLVHFRAVLSYFTYYFREQA